MGEHVYVKVLELIEVAFWVVKRPGSGRVELDMLAFCSCVIERLGRADVEISAIHTVEASVPRRKASTK